MSLEENIMDCVMDNAEERSRSSTGSPQEYREAFNRAKKRRKNLKRKINSLNPRDVSPSASENTMAFKVTSSRDSETHYTVRITNSSTGFRFSCNCGDQYGIPTRDHCRHIATVITSMLGKYVDLCFKKSSTPTGEVKEMDVTELETMFANFMHISEKR